MLWYVYFIAIKNTVSIYVDSQGLGVLVFKGGSGWRAWKPLAAVAACLVHAPCRQESRGSSVKKEKPRTRRALRKRLLVGWMADPPLTPRPAGEQRSEAGRLEAGAA